MRDYPFRTSYWFDHQEIDTAPRLSGMRQADVAIIGGGYAGLSSAYFLKCEQPDLRIAIVEAKHIGFGASGRAAGWLMSLPPLMWMLNNFQDVQRLDDIRWARGYIQSNIDDIQRLVAAEGIACQWTPTQHVLVARNAIERATIRWTVRRFGAAGLPTTMLDRHQVEAVVGYPACEGLAYDIGTIQPYQLVRGLRDWLLKRGVTFYENSPVKTISEDTNAIRVTAHEGATLVADRVIVATNAYTGSLNLPVTRPKTSNYHTYVLMTERLTQAQIEQITRTQQPFGDPTLAFFIGRIVDGRLLFNGVDRPSLVTEADDRHTPSFDRVYQEMIRRFPFLANVPLSAAWGGPVQQNSTEAPIVQRAQENARIVLNIGYGGGSGIGMALLSGRLIVDLVLQRSEYDSDAARMRDLLAASRIPILGPVRAVAGVLRHMLAG